MKKLIVLLISFVSICSVCIFKPATEPVFASSNELIIRAYGDSISYGETLQNLNDAYPAVFAQKYIDSFQAEFLPKGVSGDTTTDLLNDLQPYISGTALDQQNFEETDIITLCIGANNVLGPAVSNLAGFLTGSVTEDQYQTLMDAGIAQFKADYPQILNAFQGKKVAVMTVYNPYKHLTLNDIQIDPTLSNFTSTIKSVLNSYDVKFQKMLNMSMLALQTINEDIRNSASENVTVVDIWELFESFNKTQYIEYINADISKLTLDSSDLSYIFQNNLIPLMSEIVSTCDPHPTKNGHTVIADEYLKNFNLFDIAITKPAGSIGDQDMITFTINSIQTGTYKFYKKSGNNTELIEETNVNTIEIKAEDLKGFDEVYAEVYVNSQKVETTKSIKIDFNNNQPDITNPENPATSKPKNIKVYIYSALIGVPLVGIVIYFIAKRKRDF